MQKHEKIYRKYLNKGEQDVILSEYPGDEPRYADDIHHIVYRSQGGTDEIDNLIALTRGEHNRAHFKEEPYIYPDELHKLVNKRKFLYEC